MDLIVIQVAHINGSTLVNPLEILVESQCGGKTILINCQSVYSMKRERSDFSLDSFHYRQLDGYYHDTVSPNPPA